MGHTSTKHAPTDPQSTRMFLPHFSSSTVQKQKCLLLYQKVNPDFCPASIIYMHYICDVAIFSTILRFSFEILTRMILYRLLLGIEQVTVLVGTMLWNPGQCQAGCPIISSFEVRMKAIYSWKYTSFAAEKLISH